MKLISILTENSGDNISKKSIIAEGCSLGHALTMIELWCYSNNADYPNTSNIWKNNGNIKVSVTTRDGKYTNVFNIED